MSIYFDPTRNVYVDTESGAIIPADESDSGYHTESKSIAVPTSDATDGDHALALSLAEMESAHHDLSFSENRSMPKHKTATNQSFYNKIMSRINSGDYVFRHGHFKGHDSANYIPANPTVQNDDNKSESGDDDWFLARALQAMEFEIQEDLNPFAQSNTDHDFTNKELRASSCITQLTTLSTVVVLCQIGVLVAMIQIYGYAPRSLNPMIGPDAQALVNFGAKEAGLIIVRKQWWRCLTAVFLHAGILHLVSNGAIQLRVGGYLNQVYGNTSWFLIYFVSGFFGNMMSCIFSEGSISVGSSGAVLGMLSSWIVWIIFRWKKIPDRAKGNRNCQLAVVLACVAITLGTSFSKYIDWAAHYGGAAMGILWGILLISRELEDTTHRWAVRIASLLAICGLITWALYTMLALEHPDIILEPTNM